MVEALATLGVACNVLAVVDFSWTLLTEAREIYKADTGASENVVFLETIVDNVKDHDDRLARSATEDEGLKKLIEASKEITAQLSAALASMKSNGRTSKWKSFKAALKETWKENKVKSLVEKIGTLQMQISRHLLISNSNTIDETGRVVKGLSDTISSIQMTNRQLGIERKKDLNTLERNLTKVVEGATSITEKGLKKLCKAIAFKDDISIDDILLEEKIEYDNWKKKAAERRTGIEDKLFTKVEDKFFQPTAPLLSYQPPGQILAAAKELSEAAELNKRDQDFLECFHFSNRTSRLHNIDDPHENTFQWILRDDSGRTCDTTIRFRHWLEKGSGVYWISGKPGSGKSTLIKFLSQNKKVEEYLHGWANEKILTTASFYFWNAGSTLQKSQEGLLRSIIFELLRKCQDLIPVAQNVAKTESSFEQKDRSWRIDDLLSIYAAIVTHTVNMKFCLFIDGLDEFGEEKRTQRDLLNTIHRLKQSPNIKLCLSSRPWTEFVDEFGNDSNQLKLEDLTQNDIECYVTDHFRNHSQFKVLSAEDVAYADFIRLVVDRAQGVFLWVYLVTRELLQGLTYHDSLKTLRRRLDGFPPDLENFFNVLIHLIDPVYHKDMARYYYFALTANESLPGRYYSFMDDLEDAAMPERHDGDRFMSKDEDRRRLDRLRRRLDGRTRGLLEIKHPHNGDGDRFGFWRCRVEFLHRTARDFLRSSDDIRSLTEKELGNETPSLRACEAILASSKMIPYQGEDYKAYVIKEKAVDERNFFFFASISLKIPDCAPDLEQMLIAAEEADDFIRDRYNRGLRPRYWVAMVAAIGFYSYLEKKLQSQPEVLRPSPLYDEPVLYTALHETDSISLECIKLLLEKGADPNAFVRSEGEHSVWQSILASLERKQQVFSKEILYKLLHLFISHGADFEFPSDNKKPKSTMEMLTEALDSCMALKLHEHFLGKEAERNVNNVIAPPTSWWERRKSRRTFRLFQA